ncbi:MAG: hypothetical protein WBG27_04275, partial [Candidatus Aquilonibacter sp.]
AACVCIHGARSVGLSTQPSRCQCCTGNCTPAKFGDARAAFLPSLLEQYARDLRDLLGEFV